jgi:hypothetical protein
MTGDWRPLNLERPPFNFPPPAELLAEGCTEAEGRFLDKCLGLWAIKDLADADSAELADGAEDSLFR